MCVCVKLGLLYWQLPSPSLCLSRKPQSHCPFPVLSINDLPQGPVCEHFSALVPVHSGPPLDHTNMIHLKHDYIMLYPHSRTAMASTSFVCDLDYSAWNPGQPALSSRFWESLAEHHLCTQLYSNPPASRKSSPSGFTLSSFYVVSAPGYLHPPKGLWFCVVLQISQLVTGSRDPVFSHL